MIHLIQLLERIFFALKAEVDKCDINEVVNVPAGLNNFKTKVDDLKVGKMKTSRRLKKIESFIE